MVKDNRAYCHYSNLPAHLHRLISLSFLPFRVCSKKETLIPLCNQSLLGQVGIWCQNDVALTLMRRHLHINIDTTSFHDMCSLGVFMHDMGEMDGHKLLSE